VRFSHLVHFSDDGTIDRFVPRPVRVPSQRATGEEWMNGPLVWAVDPDHEAAYLFPRDCPRIVLWATSSTTSRDRERWLGGDEVVAHVEPAGAAQMDGAALFRYWLPVTSFRPTSDAWMWVSDVEVVPTRVDHLTDLRGELTARGGRLEVTEDLGTLAGAWTSTVHASGIRLRAASSWPST
jgi:hypothetical protein